MSWSFSGEVDTASEDWTQKIRDLSVFPEPHESIKKEQEASVRWAKETLVDAVDCNVVGRYGLSYRVSANGHTNPDKKPQQGFVNDSVTVTIYSMENQS